MRYDDLDSDTEPGRATGLLATLQRLLATFIEILHTRLEILAIELEEEGVRFRQLVIYGLVSVFFLGLGLLVATALVVLIFWEPYRVHVLAGFAAFYLIVGVSAALAARHMIKNRPRPFSVTLSELAKDHERLTSRS